MVSLSFNPLIYNLNVSILCRCRLQTAKNMQSDLNFKHICNPVLNPFPNKPWFFMCLQYKSFENTVGKGEIAQNEQFLPFPTVFSTFLENFLVFSSNLKLSSANSFSLEESKICRLGKC